MTTGYCLNSTSQIQSSGYEGHFDNGAEIICCPLFIPKLWSPMQFPEPRQDNFIEWILIIVQGNSTLGVCGVKSKIGVVCSLILRFRYDLEKYFSIDTSLPPPARPSLTQAVLGLSRLARQCSAVLVVCKAFEKVFWTWSKCFFEQLIIDLSPCEETQTGDS